MKKRRPSLDPRETTAIVEVRAVYGDLAARPITRACTLRTECCQFKLTGRTPQLTRGEALVAAKALRATGRKQLPNRTDGACPLLDERTARCLIYDGRPFGCRTHYCAAAGGPTARRDVLDLIRRLEVIDEQLDGDGPHPIHSAVERALASLP